MQIYGVKFWPSSQKGHITKTLASNVSQFSGVYLLLCGYVSLPQCQSGQTSKKKKKKVAQDKRCNSRRNIMHKCRKVVSQKKIVPKMVCKGRFPCFC